MGLNYENWYTEFNVVLLKFVWRDSKLMSSEVDYKALAEEKVKRLLEAAKNLQKSLERLRSNTERLQQYQATQLDISVHFAKMLENGSKLK